MTLEKINKKMPFVEKEDYVEHLLEDVTRNAIQHQRPARRFSIKYVAGIAASFLLLAGLSTAWYFHPSESEAPAMAQVREMDPLDQFLCNISDEEVKYIEYYEIEELTFQYE